MNNKRKKESRAGYVLILPSFIGFCVFMVYPIVYSFFLSFMDWDFMQGYSKSEFIGWDNYIAAFSNEYFQIGLINNLKLLFIAVPILLALALVLAYILNGKIFGRGAIRAAFFMPYVTTVTATAIVFSALFHEEMGPVNQILRSIGIENVPRWLSSITWALPTIGIFWIWRMLGYCIIIFLAGLQNISSDVYEAASIDGTSGWQKFRYITLPLISPTTFFLAVTMGIFSFSMLAEVKVMTGGGPGNATYTLVYHIYTEAFTKFDMGYASAVAILFFIIIMIITLIQWIGQEKWVNY